MLTPLDATSEIEWSNVVDRLCAELRRPAPGSTPPPPCPYPGMVPFTAADSGQFFGREREIAELWQRLRHQNYMFVIGPSGSGKSSLVFAGLVPELDRQQPGTWVVKPMHPGDSPLANLADILGAELRPDTLFAPLVAALLAQQPQARRLVLIVDQFEELFAQAPAPDQRDFIHAIQQLRRVPDCVLVLTMRADFYEDLMTSDLWPEDSGQWTSQRMEIAPLRGQNLRHAIAKPAEELRVYLESGLLERLLADAADEPGVLPLIQATMDMLWAKIERRLLPLSAYEQLGADGRSGLAVAIARKADAALATMQPPAQLPIARRIFLRLIQFGEGRADTRREQPESALRAAGDDQDSFDETLQHLVRNRLLTPNSQEKARDRKINIAHEIVIGSWPQLRQWAAERRDAEQTRRRLEGQAAEWARLGRGQGGLLDAAELPEAERWLHSTEAADLGYSSHLPAFVGESRKAVRRGTRNRIAAWSSIAALIIVALLTALLFQSRLATQQSQARAESFAQLLVAKAEIARTQDDDVRHGLLIAIEAMRRAKSQAVEADLVLRQGLSLLPIPIQNGKYNGSIRKITITVDGRYMASASSTGAVWLHDFSSGGREVVSVQHDGPVVDLTFTLDGKYLATASEDKSVRVWEVPSGNLLARFDQGGKVQQVVFSQDGKLLTAVADDHTVQQWDWQQKQSTAKIAFPEVEAFTLSQYGTYFAAFPKQTDTPTKTATSQRVSPL